MSGFFGDYVYQYEIAALIYMVVILWLFLKLKDFPLETNTYFKYLLISAIICTLADLASLTFLDHPTPVPLFIRYFVLILYYVPNMFCIIFYCLMSLSMTRQYQQNIRWKYVFTNVVAVVDTLLVFISPFTRWLYYIDENNSLKHGPLMPVRYVVAFVLLILIAADLIRHQRLLTKLQKHVAYGYTLAVVIGLLLTFFNDHLLILNFTISVAMLLGYLALKNPSDSKDEDTNVGNLQDFKAAMSAYFRARNEFSLLCAEYESLDYYEKVLGSKYSREIARELAERISTIVPRNLIYRVSRRRFVILLPHKDSQIKEYVRKLIDYGNSALDLEGISILLEPALCVLHSPESIAYVEDVEDSIDFAFKERKKLKDESQFYSPEESVIIKKRRDQAILRVLRRAINNDEFQVVFQPIFSSEKNMYTYAEAFARLSDQTLGVISPSEFIPIAEKNGLIVELGEIVLEHVCRFIHEHLGPVKGFEGISINLSPIQCMQYDFAEKTMATLNKYNVEPRLIEFELTAETMSHVHETFTPIMTQLSNLGMRFTIDNYAVNMADAPLLTAIPLSNIKISRLVTDKIIESDRLVPAMKGSISSLKDLGYHVIATGIETAETAEQFRTFGCDYLQGFYYSTPLKSDEFAGLLRSE